VVQTRFPELQPRRNGSQDPRLIGGGETARYMKFGSLDDVNGAERDLLDIVNAWCTSRD